jgi:hypothetical protein
MKLSITDSNLIGFGSEQISAVARLGKKLKIADPVTRTVPLLITKRPGKSTGYNSKHRRKSGLFA